MKTRNGLGALVQSDGKIKIIRNQELFIGPQWIEHVLWHSISSWQWSYNSLWSRREHMMHIAPTDKKAPKGRMKYVSHHESETLHWQFCWYLVPSKLTTHRHCRLLWTRSWSHNQSKFMCCQLSKKYKINWIGLWTISCCQSMRQNSDFQSWMPLK